MKISGANVREYSRSKIYAIVPGNRRGQRCFLEGAEELRLAKIAFNITFFS
jgi:hypothetical protein